MKVAPTIRNALGAMPAHKERMPPPCLITCFMVDIEVAYSGFSLGTTNACILVFTVSRGCVLVTASNPPVIPAMIMGVPDG